MGNPVSDFWQKQVDSYDQCFSYARCGANVPFLERIPVASLFAEGAGGALLDCGVGTGQVALAVLRAGRFTHATLIDISSEMLRATEPRIKSSFPELEAEYVCSDVFAYLEHAAAGRQFDVILCLGLIAHTGRLDQLLCLLRPRLAPDGRILLQSSLLDHWGVRLQRALSGRRYAVKHGYPISYYSHRDIERAAGQAGLHIRDRWRCAVGIPYGDRISPRLNSAIERRLHSWARRHGAEALYRIEAAPDHGPTPATPPQGPLR